MEHSIYIQLSPKRIRFSQDTISRSFRNSITEVNNVILEIAKHNMDVGDIPPIRVVENGGRFYSANNRRLYVFRVLCHLGILDEINVVVQQRLPQGRMTTSCDGCHVKIRSSQHNAYTTYRHCDCYNGMMLCKPEWWDEAAGRLESDELVYPESFTSLCVESDSEEEDEFDDVVRTYTRSRPTTSSSPDRSSRSDGEISGAVVAGAAIVGVAAGIGYLLYSALSSQRDMAPLDIRFSQDSIAAKFRDGQSVNQTILKVALGMQRSSNIERIKVVRHNGQYWSLDNRRLYVFRVLNLMGLLDEVKVTMCGEDSLESRRFTTDCSGCHVNMRGPATYRNCQCQTGGHMQLPAWWNHRAREIRQDKLSTAELQIFLRSRTIATKKEEECIIQ